MTDKAQGRHRVPKSPSVSESLTIKRQRANEAAAKAAVKHHARIARGVTRAWKNGGA